MNVRRYGWLAGWIFCVGCSSGTTGSQPSVGGAGGASGMDASNLGGGAGSGTSGTTASGGSAGRGGSSVLDASTTGQGGASGTGGSSDSGEMPDGRRDSVDARTDTLSSDAAVEFDDAGICARCTGNEVCVEHQTVGGAIHPLNDAGGCDDGFVVVPDAPFTCSRPPTFQCAQLPSTCNTNPASVAVAHCTCARSLCVASSCTDVSPTHMRCVQMVP